MLSVNTRFTVLLLFFLVTPVLAQAQTVFNISLDGAQANGGAGTGSAFVGFGTVTLNAAETQITLSALHDVPNGNVILGHIHTGNAGVPGPVTFPLSGGGTSPINDVFAVTSGQVATLKADGLYLNIHTTLNPGGEIRGQILGLPVAAPLNTGVIAVIAGLGIVAAGVTTLRRTRAKTAA